MRQTILIVDDDKTNVKVAQSILERDYKVIAALSGERALKLLEQVIPDLLLLDISMPEMDGFQVMEELKASELWRGIPVIFLTGSVAPEVEARCFQIGAVDFIGKPFIPEVILNRINRTLELQQYRKSLEDAVQMQAQKILMQSAELQKKQQELMNLQQEVISSMANLIESRDGSTGGHIRRTSRYVQLIAEELHRKQIFPELNDEEYVENLYKAAALHDIGKIYISDMILQKPGKLSDSEFEVMKTHSAEGGRIIRQSIGNIEKKEFLEVAYDIATYHHEKWNGSGYPEGRKGKDIPLSARIMAVVDVFDALVSERCYKKTMPAEQAFHIIRISAGSHFDPQITETFLALRSQIEAIMEESQEK